MLFYLQGRSVFRKIHGSSSPFHEPDSDATESLESSQESRRKIESLDIDLLEQSFNSQSSTLSPGVVNISNLKDTASIGTQTNCHIKKLIDAMRYHLSHVVQLAQIANRDEEKFDSNDSSLCSVGESRFINDTSVLRAAETNCFRTVGTQTTIPHKKSIHMASLMAKEAMSVLDDLNIMEEKYEEPAFKKQKLS